MPRTPLFLVGMRGSGKTTVGRLLAQRLGWGFVDADEALEAGAGMSVREVFAAEGEAGFREREAATLRELARLDAHVVATGGGVVLRDDNRRALAGGTVVYLTADVDSLWGRVRGDAATAQRRPALAGGGRDEVAELLARRQAIYRACADHAVETAGRTPEDVADEIARRLAAPRKLLVTDFDGTLTRRDFFHLVVEAFAPDALAEFWDGYKAGRYTHFEALAGIFASIRTTEAELLEVVGRAELEPDLKPWLARLDAAGWDVVVASAGCRWYIDRLLATAGVELEVFANPGRFERGRLRMELPTSSPYFDAHLGIDKAAVVLSAAGREVAFAGDGFPDAAAARLVPAGLRFARADLATALGREGLAYRPFGRWAEVAAVLCEGG